ncbi:MAG: plastocyanin/azurin family copper-binding protein [Candidatus Nanohaloarchaea archaeon]
MDYKIALIFLGLLIVTSGCVNSTTDSPEQDNQMPESPETDGADQANSSDQEADSSSDEVDRTIQVAGGSYYFNPDNIDIEQGQTVKFVLQNDGGFHDMVIPEMNAGTDRINSGETDSFTVTFEETGEFEFICTVGTHAQQGMRGTINVS